ncbi:MAG: hypothetical protein WCC48_11840 [Anaeromyxobacteraceae bacterium]
MSKLKNPHDKKQVSLERDRRSPTGAYDTSSHEKVAQKKARINRSFRHDVHQKLHVDGSPVEELDLDVLDTKVVTTQRERFKKAPAVPLVDFIEQQTGGRVRRAGTHSVKAAAAKARKAVKDAKKAPARKAPAKKAPAKKKSAAKKAAK